MTALIIYSSLKGKLKERQLNSLFLWLMVKWYLFYYEAVSCIVYSKYIGWCLEHSWQPKNFN